MGKNQFRMKIVEVDRHFTAYDEKDMTEDNKAEFMTDRGVPGAYSYRYAVRLSFKQVIRAIFGKRICFDIASHRAVLFSTSDDDPFVFKY